MSMLIATQDVERLSDHAFDGIIGKYTVLLYLQATQDVESDPDFDGINGK